MENENNSLEKAPTELFVSKKQKNGLHIDKSAKVFDKEMVRSTFMACPSVVILEMFKNLFGNDLQLKARGRMLEMKISNYEVTICTSFKKLEQTEE